MGSGLRIGRRFLAVSALVCAIGGLVLTASALPPLASESPASGVFDDVPERQTDDEMADETASSLPATPGGTGGGSSGLGASVGSIGGSGIAGNPLVGGLFNDLIGGVVGGGIQSSGTASDTGSSDDADGAGAGSTDTSRDASDSTNDPTSERTVDGTDEQASAARGGDEVDTGQDDGSDGDGSSLPDAVSDAGERPVTTGLAVVAALAVGYLFYTREDPIGTLLSIPGKLVSLALAGVVACSQALERAVAALRGLRSIADLPGLVLAAITGAVRSIQQRIRTMGSSLPLLGGDDGLDPVDRDADTQPPARERIRHAFQSVIDASPMYTSRVATATPADVAQSATDAGAPDDPVETITDSFRDVEYGDRDPDAYLERTVTAHDRLRDAIDTTADDDGGDSDAGTPSNAGESDE